MDNKKTKSAWVAIGLVLMTIGVVPLFATFFDESGPLQNEGSEQGGYSPECTMKMQTVVVGQQIVRIDSGKNCNIWANPISPNEPVHVFIGGDDGNLVRVSGERGFSREDKLGFSNPRGDLYLKGLDGEVTVSFMLCPKSAVFLNDGCS